PGVGEDRCASAVCRDLLRYLVTFEHVLERFDFEAKLVSQADEHQDLAGDVAVRVHVAFAFEDFDERLELQISARRNEVLVLLRSLAILIPRALVIARACERIANHFLNAHARVWITALNAGQIRRTGTLYVFTKRKLDPRYRARKKKLARRPAPF